MGNFLFFDTNALLNLQELAFKEFFYISQKTLEEIEEIKVSASKDQETKYKARRCARLLDENPDNYEVIFLSPEDFYSIIREKSIGDSPDVRILSAAYHLSTNKHLPIIFVSDDISAKCLSRKVFNLPTKGITELNLVTDEQKYTGYKDVAFSDEEMSEFYCNLNNNKFGCLENEYLIVRKSDGEIVDSLRWTNNEFKKVCNKTIKSTMFGDKIRPKDIYQSFAIDSILNNTMTAISGKAGSGKSLLSLITIMYLIENGKYDRVVIMSNPTKARGASDLGFYPGNVNCKLMSNSLGSILTTKFGDRFAVDMLLKQDKIRLVSMADVRGMEVRDDEILYISECQNTSVELLKLCLSRASSGCKIIIEGDYTTQVDSYLFEGSSNGMKRVIDVLKGEPEFGYVDLPNIWRSKIANLVEKL